MEKHGKLHSAVQDEEMSQEDFTSVKANKKILNSMAEIVQDLCNKLALLLMRMKDEKNEDDFVNELLSEVESSLASYSDTELE